VVLNPNPTGRLYFSQEEVKQLLVSLGALTIAFMGMVGGGLDGIMSSGTIGGVLALAAFGGFAALTGFVMHELGHKFMAQHFGNHSEYQWYPTGLVMAVVLGLFSPFVFLAPGVAMSYGYLDREQKGWVSAAGVIINIINGVILAILSILSAIAGNSFMASLFGFGSYINLFFAGFNLIPFGPLDGAKIMAEWGMPRYVALWVAVISVGIFFF